MNYSRCNLITFLASLWSMLFAQDTFSHATAVFVCFCKPAAIITANYPKCGCE